MLSRQGARVAILLQIRDDPGSIRANLQSGIFFANGKKKPSFTAVRFPFVADRNGKHKARLWGKAPHQGKVAIGRTDGKAVLTGGIGLVLMGRSRKHDSITVTWLKD